MALRKTRPSQNKQTQQVRKPAQNLVLAALLTSMCQLSFGDYVVWRRTTIGQMTRDEIYLYTLSLQTRMPCMCTTRLACVVKPYPCPGSKQPLPNLLYVLNDCQPIHKIGGYEQEGALAANLAGRITIVEPSPKMVASAQQI